VQPPSNQPPTPQQPNATPPVLPPSQPQGFAQPGYPPPPGYSPQGYPPPPNQPPGRRIPWWAFVLGGCGCLALFVPIVAAILFPVFAQARESARQTSCMSNQKQIALGILMYSQDYDETFPLKNPWMTLLEPYTKNDGPFHCPTVSQNDPSIYGYAYDSRLSGFLQKDMQTPREVWMTFDSTTLSKNASDAGTSLPWNGRHRGRNVASFADGHVAGMSPGADLLRQDGRK
jgi:prepilin-type processing-associated H-X9-DG protein